MKTMNPMMNQIKKLICPENLSFRTTLTVRGNIALSKRLFKYNGDGSPEVISSCIYDDGYSEPLVENVFYEYIPTEEMDKSCSHIEFDGMFKEEGISHYYLRRAVDNNDPYHILKSYHDTENDNRIYKTEEFYYDKSSEKYIWVDLFYGYTGDLITEVQKCVTEFDVHGGIDEDDVEEFTSEDFYDFDDDDIMHPTQTYKFKYDARGRVVGTVAIDPEYRGVMAMISENLLSDDLRINKSQEEIVQDFKEMSNVAIFPTLIDTGSLDEFEVSEDIVNVQSILSDPHINIAGYEETHVDDYQGTEIVRYLKANLKDEGHKIRSMFDDDEDCYWVGVDHSEKPYCR